MTQLLLSLFFYDTQIQVSRGEETHIIKVKGMVVSVDMEQHEAGDVSVGHRELGPDLVADAEAGEIRKVGIGLIKFVLHTG